MAATAMGSIGGGRLAKFLMVLQLFLTINVDCINGNPDPLDIHVNVHQHVDSHVNVHQHVDINIAKPKGSSIGKHLDDLEPNELWLHILHQLDRPYENCSIYRGENNYVYYLDNEKIYPDERSSPIIIPHTEHFTTGKQRFKKLLNYTQGRNVVPSLFDPDVKEAFNELYQVYLENPGAKGILMVAVNGKKYVNEFIHTHTLMHALAYDNELDGYTLPGYYDVLPELFAEDCVTNTGNDCCETDEYPENLTEGEWKVSYWREDAGFNDFHGSYHLYNTWGGDDITITHGELFYYFHNQLVARYDWERLSNGLDLVKALEDWNSLIPQNYIPPVLTNTLKRCANMPSEVMDSLTPYRNNFEQDIADEALKKDGGGAIPIDTDDGIKYLGCAVERANCGDIDPDRYSSLHNTGHWIISKINCVPPEPAYVDIGVMINIWAAVRDPIFFRWHKFIDDLFQLQKNIAPVYQLSELVMDEISVSSVDVWSKGDNPEGQLYTFNSRRKLTLWRGQNTAACIYQPHTNHYPFIYNISISSKNYASLDVNVRIYLAPKQSSNNSPLNYTEQRTLWALMDRFKTKLQFGDNSILRDSCDSTITTPPPKSLNEISKIYAKPNTCQCGLPEHLLIPRGNSEGMPYQLFIYVTPYDDSQVRPSDCENLECSDLCSKDYTRCLHSDGEVMGFPFDRPLTTIGSDPINNIEDLANKLSNAMMHDIKIFYDTDVLNSDRQCSN